MAGGKVRALLCSNHDYLDGAERSKTAKDDVRKFMVAVVEKDFFMEAFDEFANNLVKELEKCCVSTGVTFRSKHMNREKL